MGMIWELFKRLPDLPNPAQTSFRGATAGERTRNLEIPGSSLRDARE
jgi:hypothetical protein